MDEGDNEVERIHILECQITRVLNRSSGKHMQPSPLMDTAVDSASGALPVTSEAKEPAVSVDLQVEKLPCKAIQQQNDEPMHQVVSKVACNPCCEVCNASDAQYEMRTCTDCEQSAHVHCYDGHTVDLQDTHMATPWQCDRCADRQDSNDHDTEESCVFCYVSTGIMKRLEAQQTQHCRQRSVATDTKRFHYTHPVCMQWEPYCEHPENDDEEEMRRPSCCFCHKRDGMQLQCRRLHCARAFHPKCAQTRGGLLELRTLSRPDLVEVHAYCDRHQNDRAPGLMTLLERLQTRSIKAVLTRDTMKQLRALEKPSVDANASIVTVVHAIVSLVASECRASLAFSRTDPPTFRPECLQVLQMVLDHVAQLERLAPMASHRPADRMALISPDSNDALVRALTKMFHRSKSLGKTSGTISQSHKCQVCQQPFHERQHLFYCRNESPDHIHVQHWKCTKRKASTDQEKSGNGSFGKKKLTSVSIVQHGVWLDLKIPKNLHSVSGGVVCGVCRCPVDLRGVLASRKESKHMRLEYEKQPSTFMNGGCFVNSVEKKPSMAVAIGRRSKSTRSEELTAEEADGPADLKPQRMERLNVRRTTRWLACIAHVIRLASRKAHYQEDEPKAEDETTEVNSLVPTPVNEPKTDDHETKLQGLAQEDTKAAEDGTKMLVQPPQLVEHPLPSEMQAYLDEAKRIARPFDPYTLHKITTAETMLKQRNGPAMCILKALVHEYTRFVYMKHVRAVEKATNEKRKREEQEAEEERARARKRMDQEAEMALKKQMLALRKKQRRPDDSGSNASTPRSETGANTRSS